MRTFGWIAVIFMAVIIQYAAIWFAHASGINVGYIKGKSEAENALFVACQRQTIIIRTNRSLYWCKRGKRL